MYLNKNFLLTNKTAIDLYNNYAANMPIFDYHCHLSEKELLEDKIFIDMFEVWLSGDHYKWRLMRNYGIDERFITGNATHKEKFIAYCEALGTAFGNPLYHWSQVELKDFFDCDIEINLDNADKIWEYCNDYIQQHELTPSKLIKMSNVKHIFTTNEVFDDTQTFVKLAEKYNDFTVNPAFRADKIMNIDADRFVDFIKLLENETHAISSLDDLEDALNMRLMEFIKVGCKASDISVEKIYLVPDRIVASRVFKKRLAGEFLTNEEAGQYKGYLTYSLMRMYGDKNIACEVHIGAMRNNNSVMLSRLGLDSGYDSISDENSITSLSRLLDKLNTEGVLPRCIIFNLNPKMNAEIMSLIGCFQDGSARGKIQFGPAWWFLDNKVGMRRHLEDLTATGHIATFIGMLTDSRSFLSYPRHHYFRRILCNYLGELVENGEITDDMSIVGKVISDVSYNNSCAYFNMKA